MARKRPKDSTTLAAVQPAVIEPVKKRLRPLAKGDPPTADGTPAAIRHHAGTNVSTPGVRVLVLGDLNVDTLIATLPRPTAPPTQGHPKGPMAWQSEGSGRRYRRL